MPEVISSCQSALLHTRRHFFTPEDTYVRGYFFMSESLLHVRGHFFRPARGHFFTPEDTSYLPRKFHACQRTLLHACQKTLLHSRCNLFMPEDTYSCQRSCPSKYTCVPSMVSVQIIVFYAFSCLSSASMFVNTWTSLLLICVSCWIYWYSIQVGVMFKSQTAVLINFLWLWMFYDWGCFIIEGVLWLRVFRVRLQLKLHRELTEKETDI